MSAVHAYKAPTIELSPAIAHSLERAANRVRGGCGGDGTSKFLDAVRATEDLVPPQIRDTIAPFRRAFGRAGALLIRGMPVPPSLPATPTAPATELSVPIGSEPYLAAIGLMLGIPIGFQDWHRGTVLQNLFPLPAEADRQNASNAVYLELHTETAFREDTPDFVLLLCLRDDPRQHAETYLADLAEAIAALPKQHRETLAQPAFAFRRCDGSLTEAKSVVQYGKCRRLHYAEALLGICDAANAALAALKASILHRLGAVVLRPGDLLVIDNSHMVHGRSAHRPHYDGRDRWLQRMLIVTS
jgi:L-asparagine oxygenase